MGGGCNGGGCNRVCVIGCVYLMGGSGCNMGVDVMGFVDVIKGG